MKKLLALALSLSICSGICICISSCSSDPNNTPASNVVDMNVKVDYVDFSDPRSSSIVVTSLDRDIVDPYGTHKPIVAMLILCNRNYRPPVWVGLKATLTVETMQDGCTNIINIKRIP